MKRLKGFDALMYFSENRIAPQHVLGVLVLDPSTCPGGKVDRKSLETLVLSRMEQLDIFRKRIVKAPFNITFPALLDDLNFRIQNHFKHIALPKPGNYQQLAELVGDIASTSLDMKRPLWEMTLIDGFDDGKYSVLVTKTHHCLMDGVGGAQMMPQLLDSEPLPPPGVGDVETSWAVDYPSKLELWRSDIMDLRGDYLELASTLGKLGKNLAGKALHTVGKKVSSLPTYVTGTGQKKKLSVLQRETPDEVPLLYFNRAVTSARNVAFGNMPMDGIKEIRKALGLTFNDVVLGLCAVGLRHFLEDHQALPKENLVATMPISIHGDLSAEGLNQMKIVETPLPIQISDTLTALRRMGAIMDEVKATHLASKPSDVKLTKLIPPPLGALFGRLYGIEGLSDYVRVLKTNLAISTIAGPSMPLYMAGARLASICPVGPLADGVGLTISVMTYEGVANFTIAACPDHLPDVQSMADHIHEAYDEALSAVRKPKKARKKKVAPKKSVTAKSNAHKKSVGEKSAELH